MGVYFRRFRGGALQSSEQGGRAAAEHLDLETHATYGFLLVSSGTMRVEFPPNGFALQTKAMGVHG